jgi:hydroxymethylpyrimidine/phosphomethylpyrimidine kinase
MAFYALSIAGSDPTAGAGLQADLKTFASCGIHSFSATTVVTCQGKTGMVSSAPLPESLIAAQLEPLITSFDITVVKIGALASVAQSEVVAYYLGKIPHASVIYDPVFASSNGHPFANPRTLPQLVAPLLPITTCITPNRAEAEHLWGQNIRNQADIKRACSYIANLGAKSVYLKGGHMEGDLQGVDTLYANGQYHKFLPKQVFAEDMEIHGTGCTLSTLVAAYVFHGHEIESACRLAKKRMDLLLFAAAAPNSGTKFLWPFSETLLKIERLTVR